MTEFWHENHPGMSITKSTEFEITRLARRINKHYQYLRAKQIVEGVVAVRPSAEPVEEKE